MQSISNGAAFELERITNRVLAGHNKRRTENREESDSYCKEDDGCPTELAVLQRFWRGQPIPDKHYPEWFKNEKGCSAQVHVEHYFPKGYNPDEEPWKSIKAFCNAQEKKISPA